METLAPNLSLRKEVKTCSLEFNPTFSVFAFGAGVLVVGFTSSNGHRATRYIQRAVGGCGT